MERKITSNKILSITIALVCLYFLLADYSVYYIKYSNAIAVVIGILVLIVSNATRRIFDKRRMILSRVFFGAWLLVFLISTIINVCPVHLALYLQVIFGTLFVAVNDDLRKSVFVDFVRLYCIFLVLSFVEYALYFVGANFSLGTVYRGDNPSPFINSLFNLIRVSTPRFQSLAEEPGVIGTINGFLFHILQSKEYRKQKYIVLLTGIFTFSIAFYVICFISIISSNRRLIVKVIPLFAVVGILMLFPSLTEQFILDRVVEERIDNRTHVQFQEMFDRANSNGELLLGKGYQAYYKELKEWDGSAGATVFIYQYGWFGVIVIFLCYLFIYVRGTPISRYSLVFFLIFWLSFYQRQFIYQPFYLLIFFSFGLFDIKQPFLKNNYKIKKLSKQYG